MKPKFLVQKVDDSEPYVIENVLEAMDADGYDILSVYGYTYSERQFLQSVKTATVIVGRLRETRGKKQNFGPKIVDD